LLRFSSKIWHDDSYSVIIIVMKKIIFLIIIICAAAAGLYYYFSVKKIVPANTIKVSGNIEATETRLSFQVAGRINKLFVDEGDFVSKGMIVATLDDDELKKVKQQAQSSYEQAKSDFNLSEKEYTRYGQLVDVNAISIQDWDVAQNKYQVTKAKLEASKNAFDVASIRLDYTSLISAVQGFVTVKSAEVGEVVQPGSTVFTVVDMNDIWLTAYIMEADMGKVLLNQQVDVKTDSYPNKIYQGIISFISQESEFTPKYIQTPAERVKLVYRIKIDVKNPNIELKPGMPADGYIRE
jgi:HlyD family secretion protein